MRSESTREDIERVFTKQTLRVLVDSAVNGTELVDSTIHVTAAIKVRESQCRLIQLVRMLTFALFHTHSHLYIVIIIITHQI